MRKQVPASQADQTSKPFVTEVCEAADRDNDGGLTARELYYAAFLSMDLGLARLLKRLSMELDTNGDQDIDAREVAAFARSSRAAGGEPYEMALRIRHLFPAVDSDSDGRLNGDELLRLAGLMMRRD